MDLGFPTLMGTSTLTVNILRNQNPPEFIDEPYSVTIDRNQAVGSNIYRVTAVDIDVQAPFGTLEYDIIGDDSASVFFRIDSVTGSIFMRDTISNDATDTYYVSYLSLVLGKPVLCLCKQQRPVHLCSLISTFVVCCLDSMILNPQFQD